MKKLLLTLITLIVFSPFSRGADYYLCGYNNKWNFDENYKFTDLGNGIYQYHIEKINSDIFSNGFKIAEKDWKSQYGATGALVVDRAISCVKGDGNNIKLSSDIKSITGATLIFDISNQDKPTLYVRPDMYLSGSINNWSNTNENYRFTYNNSVYTLSLDQLNGDFRIAAGVNDKNDDWMINYGGAQNMTAGTYDCIEGPGNNMSLSVQDRENVILTFDCNNKKLSVTHPDYDALANGIYLSCADNNWSTDNIDYKFNQEGDKYTLHLSSLPAEFKVVTSSREYDLGTSETMVFGSTISCINGGNNFSFPEGVTAVAGATLTLDFTDVAIPTLTVMPDLYLAGEITNWSNTNVKYRFKENDGIYTLSVDELSGKFRIAGGTTPQWLVNFGGEQNMTTGKTYTCTSGSGNDMTVSGGSLSNAILTFDYNTLSLSIATMSTEVTADGLYLAGAINNWASDNEQYHFTEDNGIYTLKVPRLAGDFKIVTKDWGLQFGCASKIVYGQEYSCFNTPNGNNISLAEEVALDVILTFDLENMILTAQGVPTLYLIGEFNGWTPLATYAFDYTDGIYTLKTRDFSGGFMISTLDNSFKLGSKTGNAIELDKEHPLSPDGLNISYAGLPERATSKVKVTVYTEGTYDHSTTGIESVGDEAADGPVEYFNLQGIKVNNPAKGIYIKRQGSTVEKILVK